MLRVYNTRLKSRWLRLAPVLAGLLVLVAATGASAQSQAINGTIEGKVTDASGAVLPGVTVTVTHVDTNAVRSFVTDERGEYRAPLLPLGSYRVRVELPGFKTRGLVRRGRPARAGGNDSNGPEDRSPSGECLEEDRRDDERSRGTDDQPDDARRDRR